MLAIDSPFTDPYLNLAAEEFLLKEKKEDVLFLYTDEPSVIIGKHQVMPAEVNYLFAKKHDIKIARRLSGGGTVFHDYGNLNFTFILNGTEGELVRFSTCLAPVIDALHQLGLPAEPGDKNDILLNGKKISGNAEHVFHNRTLHHGTLLFSSNLDNLREAIQPSGKYVHKGVLSRRSNVTNIAQFLRKSMNIDTFRKYIFAFLSNHFHVNVSAFSDTDAKRIAEIANQKYKTWEWIFAYSPDYYLEREIELNLGHISAMQNVTEGQLSSCSGWVSPQSFSSADTIPSANGKTHSSVNAIPVCINLWIAKGFISRIILKSHVVQKQLNAICQELQGKPLHDDILIKTIYGSLPDNSTDQLFLSILPFLF